MFPPRVTGCATQSVTAPGRRGSRRTDRDGKPSARAQARGDSQVTLPHAIVFLLDVDNTLLDNDRIIADLKRHLAQAFWADTQAAGAERADRYWTIFEERRTEFGYADYLGALQRYRAENPRDPNFLQVSFFLLDYPFADRLF